MLSASIIFLILFVICCFVSLVVNADYLENAGKSFGKLKFFFIALGTIPTLHYWISGIKINHLKFVLHAFLCSIIVCGVVALYQVITIGGRTEGLIGIMRYGYASAMVLILLIGFLLQKKNLKLQLNARLLWAAVIFGIIGLLLTQTRGALAGFICALPFSFYFFKPRLGLAIGFLGALLISFIAFAYLFGSGDYGSRYFKSRNSGGDVVRQEQWRSAVIATKEHPWFGWGYNNFYSQVERIKKENNFKTISYVNEHAHNLFLEIAAGTGLVGFILFMGWLISWAYECFKFATPLRGIFIPFGVCIIVSGQFEVIFDTTNMTLIFMTYSLSQYLRLNDN